MKKLSTILMVAAITLMQACNGSNDKDSVDKANDANDQKDTTNLSTNKRDTVANAMGVNDKVADFAVKAANGGMLEVDLGKLAQQKAVNKKVKDFGQMMVTDHSKANDQLKALAAQNNITLPDSVGNDNRSQINDLSKESGKDFDKDYIDKMVSDHKDDIDLFEKAAKDSSYGAFQSFAVKTLPTLYKHLGAAKAIQKSR